MDVQFANFSASNGYTSPHFGFRMIRELTKDGTEVAQYQIQIQQGNPGLENVAGIPPGVGFHLDPVDKTASVRRDQRNVESDLERLISSTDFMAARPVTAPGSRCRLPESLAR
jgi:hypothetical protein